MMLPVSLFTSSLAASVPSWASTSPKCSGLSPQNFLPTPSSGSSSTYSSSSPNMWPASWAAVFWLTSRLPPSPRSISTTSTPPELLLLGGVLLPGAQWLALVSPADGGVEVVEDRLGALLAQLGVAGPAAPGRRPPDGEDLEVVLLAVRAHPLPEDEALSLDRR